MLVLAFIIETVLGTLFTILSIQSFVGTRYTIDKTKQLKMPGYFRYITGCIQLLGGTFMLFGVFYPIIAVLGGAWIAMTMLTGIVLRIRANESILDTLPAIIIAVLSISVGIIQIYYKNIW